MDDLRTHIKFKKANLDDAELLYEWANDKDVRANAINPLSIIWENHLEWLSEKINSNKSFILIMYLYDEAVGQIRFDYDEKSKGWELSYSIRKESRGRGLGKIIVEEGLEHFNKYPIIALVQPGNIPSRKVFESLNFTESIRIINGIKYIKYFKNIFNYIISYNLITI